MEKTYIGKISNAGAQKVSAPMPQKSQAKPKTQTGKDLRTTNK